MAEFQRMSGGETTMALELDKHQTTTKALYGEPRGNDESA
jgi:hypothetical protein